MPDKPCKDCLAEWNRRGEIPPKKTWRPVPHPGPRCVSHHRAVRKAQKTRAHENRVQAVYGLPPGAYEALYRFQGGLCAICRRATGASRRLSVDHRHDSGHVRGLLCRPCNDVLGHLRDDPEAARRIFNYLVRPPAVDLGIVAIHQENRKDDA